MTLDDVGDFSWFLFLLFEFFGSFIQCDWLQFVNRRLFGVLPRGEEESKRLLVGDVSLSLLQQCNFVDHLSLSRSLLLLLSLSLSPLSPLSLFSLLSPFSLSASSLSYLS